MADQALDIIVEAAGHRLMGEYAFHRGTATTGTTSRLTDADLITHGNDQRWKGYYLYFLTGSNGGAERFISSVDLASGHLTFTRVLPSVAAQAGDEYLLFRDFRWAEWLGFLNETVRSLYREKEVYQRGITDVLRYTLPTPISRGLWVRDVLRGPYPFAFTNAHEPKVRWFRINPLNVQGDLYLVLDSALDAREQLVFFAQVPYAHQHQTPYTMSRSVCVPFGESSAAEIAREWLVAGVVWRALVAKTRPLTGEAGRRWQVNLDNAARWYAEQSEALGVGQVGLRELGYSDPW